MKIRILKALFVAFVLLLTPATVSAQNNNIISKGQVVKILNSTDSRSRRSGKIVLPQKEQPDTVKVEGADTLVCDYAVTNIILKIVDENDADYRTVTYIFNKSGIKIEKLALNGTISEFRYEYEDDDFVTIKNVVSSYKLTKKAQSKIEEPLPAGITYHITANSGQIGRFDCFQNSALTNVEGDMLAVVNYLLSVVPGTQQNDERYMNNNNHQ